MRSSCIGLHRSIPNPPFLKQHPEVSITRKLPQNRAERKPLRFRLGNWAACGSIGTVLKALRRRRSLSANTVAYSVVPRALAPNDVAQAYQVVLNTPSIAADTLAHELLHIVTNGIHAAPYNDFMYDTGTIRSLWYSGQPPAPPHFLPDTNQRLHILQS